MSQDTRVVVVGLGPIGSAVARLVVARTGLQLVGGVDVDPSKIGRDVGEEIGLDLPLGFAVHERLAHVLAMTEADLALLTTSSHLSSCKPQVLEILEAGLDVVSTSEELVFPWFSHPQEAAEIDAAARRVGKTVLGTGVNPGYLMDALPLALTAICQQVDHVDVRRVINASTRRRSFQAKIGSGMTVEDFGSKMDAGRMGHVGLTESIDMVLDTMGRKLARVESAVEPVIADHPIQTAFFDVPPGKVIGLQQVARAYTDEGEFMTLTFCAALDAPDEQDTITIAGTPGLVVTLQGTNGDLATTAIVVNAIHRVRAAAPGLVTMRDLPLVTSW